MWHEARKQEKKIRKVIVDYRKRSERRHSYYERIKQDPTKFLQVHGRKYKVHLDGNVAAEADNNNHMMLWQGDGVTMIDRFDVRAHLDYYNEATKAKDETTFNDEERKCYFERYRVLIWNTHKNISESQHIRQIYIEEQFPDIAAKQKQKQDTEMQKQLLAQSKTSIGYDYEENVGLNKSASSNFNRGQDGDDLSESEDELDILRELEEIPPLTDMTMETITQLDEIGVKKFGLRPGGFGDCLLDDQDNIDKIDEAKALEHEKQKFSGRKSRRERRLLKDERLRGREIGHLSFVRKESSERDSDSSSESESDSSDSSQEQIQYITSFGDDSLKNKASSNSLSKEESAKKSHEKSSSTRSKSRKSRSRTPESSSSHKTSRYRSRRSRSRSRSRSRHDRSSRHYSKRSRSRSPHNERYRRRSSSSDRYSHKNRSHSKERRSRSRSGEPKSRDTIHRSKGVTAVISSTSHKSSSLAAAKLASSESKNTSAKMTPQQKLKIKMQRALNKQLKADRHAESEKRMQKYQEQLDREDNLRDMARKLRRRERDEDD